ncbi:MAG: hypothetical protein KA120_01905 [Candidatus Goldbacteria bacterium]|nr:hypothetical protein [Candidatus Goldiibacteriota bacterium]
MFCKNCGNKNGFLTVITDYKPLEMWEFNQGALTRYCQKDSGDMEVTVQCASCGSTDVDQEGFDIMMYSENPLVILSDEEWDKKLSEYKKEQIEEQEETEEDNEEDQEEKQGQEEKQENAEK